MLLKGRVRDWTWHSWQGEYRASSQMTVPSWCKPPTTSSRLQLLQRQTHQPCESSSFNGSLTGDEVVSVSPQASQGCSLKRVTYCMLLNLINGEQGMNQEIKWCKSPLWFALVNGLSPDICKIRDERKSLLYLALNRFLTSHCHNSSRAKCLGDK
jgi:hypothetical protein